MSLTNLPFNFTNFDALPPSASVSQPTVEALFSVSAATVWRWVNSGKIPQPRRYGLRTTRWNVGELRAALSAKVAA